MELLLRYLPGFRMNEYLIDTPELKMTQLDFFIRLLVIAGIGFLIGFEREYAAKKSSEESFAGVRTFIFLTTLGLLGGLLYSLVSPWLLAIVFVAVVTLIAVSYWATSRKGDIGGTTEVAAIIAFVLGLITYFGYIEESLVITVGMVLVLSSKIRLHKAIGSITPDEMFDFIRFVVMAVLIFPFLPNENYGPYHVLNPHDIGLVVLLISGIGFIGYMLMKFLGSGRGILFTGIIGGLISSTAVTWVFSRKSKAEPELSTHCATAILAASAIMIIRIIVLVFIFNKEIFGVLYLPLAFVAAVAVAACLYYFSRTRKNVVMASEIQRNSPLQLRSALLFGLLYTIIILLVSFSSERFGDEGILIASGISGITDIDAITISVSRLGGQSIPVDLAQFAILIAAVSNTLVKMGIGIWAGSGQLRLKIIAGFGVVILAAAVAYFLIAAGYF